MPELDQKPDEKPVQKPAQNPTLACSLTAPEMKTRRQFVRATLRPHITHIETEAKRVVFTFAQSIDTTQVEEFIALEQQCCGFLTFALDRTGDKLTLRITGSEGAENVLRMFADGARE